jgi:DHA2 family multidrug resistance protein
MISYIDDFWLMMWITLAAIPLAFLLKRPAAAQ